MLTRVRRVLCLWATFGAMLLVAHGAVFSTTQNFAGFSRCLIDRISSSPHFDQGDRDALRDVAGAMIASMEDTTRGPRGPSSRKVMGIAFVTSVSDVIVLEDPGRNFERTGAYRAALNECSQAAVGYVDEPFVNEAVRIMTALEANKSQRSDGPGGAFVGYPAQGPPGVLDFLGYAPSPVQRPLFVSDYSTDEKTAFGSSSAFAGSPGWTPFDSPAASQVRQPDFWSSGFIGQRPENSGFAGAGVVRDQGGAYAGSSSLASQNYPSRQASLVGGGIEVTRTRDGGFVPSGPEAQPQTYPGRFQEPPMPETRGVSDGSQGPQSPNPTVLNPTIPPAILDDIPLPEADTLEDVITGVLLNSTSFLSAFDSETDKQQAINKAILITQLSLTGYEDDIVAEALDAVSAAISTVETFTPEAYAAAISAALSTILRLHNMPLFAGGASIANSMLSSLDSAGGGAQRPENLPDYSMYSWPQSMPVAQDFQSPPLAPESVAGDIFSQTLSEKLAQSAAMTALFCGNSSLDLQAEFMLVKSATSEYGRQVSSIAAGTISAALSDLSPEVLCLGYPRIISDTIAELLYENSLLLAADPVELANKFETEVSLLQAATEKASKQTTPVPPLQSSIAGAQSSSSSAASDSVSSVYPPPSSIDGGTAGPPIAQPQKGTVGVEGTQPPGPQTTPVTTPMPLQISDQELATTLSYFDTLTEPIVPATESAPTKYPPVDQKEIAMELFDEIRSVLEALSAQSDGQHTYLPPNLEELFSLTPNISQENTTIDPVLDDDEELATKKAKNHPHKGRNNRRSRRKSTTAKPSTTGRPSDYSADGLAVDQQVYSAPQSSSHPVELYPSFQEPPVSETFRGTLPTSGGSSPTSVDSSSTSVGTSSTSSGTSSPSGASGVPNPGSITSTDDTTLAFARTVSMIATSTIAYIRTDPNFNLVQLCARLNDLALVVGIPPLDNCTEVPMIDYLLNVLGSVVQFLKGV